MKIKIEKSFAKDVDKINDRKILQRLNGLISEIEESESIDDLSSLKKIKGFKTYYRIRIGDYRLGLEVISSKTICFIRFLHRKEIYRYFPK